jgi:7-cyano-7-deazaguanine tRNA-ribosyltransferase
MVLLMSFEVRDKDLLGRIGKLKTKSCTIETPLLFPVINPRIQLFQPQKLKDTFGFESIIANAYLIRRRYGNKVAEQGLHKFLNYDGAVMTDSGAYQILVYGGIDANQTEIIRYQEQIGSDIATILDFPTGWKKTEKQANETVGETLKRAKEFFKIKARDDILWVGPIQGGRHLRLVAKSAAEMGKLPFQIYALGSPTEIMENYRFDILINMILTAKKNLPPEKPLHLFGAGHPLMFSLAVALGCDFFDSAAYALYARDDRYITENGTLRLGDLTYFPCQCPKCAASNPCEVIAKPQKERETFLAEHNLYVCSAELKRIKQAIKDGRLWEHMQMRAQAHPSLSTALKNLKQYVDFIEKYSPTSKKSGLFFYNFVDTTRPRVIRYRQRIQERYSPPENTRILLLSPQTRQKPFHKARGFKKVGKTIKQLGELSNNVHVCFYAAPFGIIPIELDEIYPLSQHEIALPLDLETLYYVANQVALYIKQQSYEAVILLHAPHQWGNKVKVKCIETCQKNSIDFEAVDFVEEHSKETVTQLEMVLRKHLRK